MVTISGKSKITSVIFSKPIGNIQFLKAICKIQIILTNIKKLRIFLNNNKYLLQEFIFPIYNYINLILRIRPPPLYFLRGDN